MSLIFLLPWVGEIIVTTTFTPAQGVICSLKSLPLSACGRKLSRKKETSLWLHWGAGIFLHLITIKIPQIHQLSQAQITLIICRGFFLHFIICFYNLLCGGIHENVDLAVWVWVTLLGVLIMWVFSHCLV